MCVILRQIITIRWIMVPYYSYKQSCHDEASFLATVINIILSQRTVSLILTLSACRSSEATVTSASKKWDHTVYTQNGQTLSTKAGVIEAWISCQLKSHTDATLALRLTLSKLYCCYYKLIQNKPSCLIHHVIPEGYNNS